MMIYIILRSHDSNCLAKMVNDKIQEGFEPLGGVAYGDWYAQAMVKREASEAHRQSALTIDMLKNSILSVCNQKDGV